MTCGGRLGDVCIQFESARGGTAFLPHRLSLRRILEATADRKNNPAMNRPLACDYVPGANAATHLQRDIESAGIVLWTIAFRNLQGSLPMATNLKRVLKRKNPAKRLVLRGL